jgi:hypothetical protein
MNDDPFFHLGRALAELLALPFKVLRGVFRLLLWLIRRRAQATPYQRGLRRASEGAFITVACVYGASWFNAVLGQSIFALAQGLADAPRNYPGAAGWAVVLLLGVIWLFSGMRDARGGDRDWMIAFWSAVIAGACIAALWRHWFPWPDRTYLTLLEIAGLKTLYIATAAACLVRLVLSVPLPSPAVGMVNRVLQQRNAPMVGARRRRFFFR